MNRNYKLIAIFIPILAFAQQDWPTYGGNAAGTRYSPLTQINPRNVAQLKVAWTYDTGDVFRNSEMQCQPIVVHGTLYATTANRPAKIELIAPWPKTPTQARDVMFKRMIPSPLSKPATPATKPS